MSINQQISPRGSLLLVAAVVTFAVLSSIDPVGAKRKAPLPVPPPPPSLPAGSIKYDYDNDGKADVGRWDKDHTEFRVEKSGGGSDAVFTLGSSSAVAAPGDYNGDGTTDAGVFNAGTWTYKISPSATPQTISLGQSGDIPQAGDYDGNGTTDACVFRPSNGTWYWWSVPDNKSYSVAYGQSGDIPIAGNYDADSNGKTDFAVFRPSNGYWYIQLNGGGTSSFPWGQANGNDIPVQGNFDSDNKSDPTIYRPSTGVWYVLKSSTNYATSTAVTWGSYGDQPVPADYDNDGMSDFAIWRPTTGVWMIIKSTDSTYSYKTLGIAGDQAIESAYTKQVAASVAGDVMGPLRVKPTNATGGTNLYSQNFGWGTSLVNLPGRSGLDAGFGISYNSLVWIKNGPVMYFDPDAGNVSPGFRFGFPSIDPIYYDSDKSKWTYLMVTPDGGRKEFRQIGAGNVFDAADSSYTQLVQDIPDEYFDPNAPVENVKMTVFTTDGTKLRYEWMAGGFRCTRITDRNGNYIKMAYDQDFGVLLTVTDTLGRVITISYDSQSYPTTITQTWKGTNGSGSNTTHTWASFSYTTKTVSVNFGLLQNLGPPNGTVIKVLDTITNADGSYTKFHYNGYIQVEKIENYADDDHKLNHVWTNLASVSGSQSDCPRFTQTKTFAENFNGGSEVTIDNTAPASETFTAHGGSESSSMVKVTVSGHPTSGFNTKTHYGPSGYKEGLIIGTEDCLSTSNCTGTNRVRWTWNEWTQDNTGVSYITNPRVTDSRVGDGTNTKRTTISYYSSGGTYPYGLPEFVKVYDTNLTTVLKTQKIVYNLGSDYTSRRIIGLPAEKYLYEGTESGTLMSKVTYTYDDYTSPEPALTDLTTPTHQCRTTSTDCPSAYGTSFTHRGNVTKTTRWDIRSGYSTDPNYAVASQVAYNIAGLPVSSTDPRNRVSTISYTDDWNDNVSRTTYAYPTTVTDPGGYSSTIEYRFDFGANVWAQSPAPTGASYGKKTSRTYEDDTGRISKEKIENSFTGFGTAYTRYYYNPNGTNVTSYSTIVDADNDGGDADDEVATLTVTDGAGRVIKTRTENPDGSNLYTAKKVQYDILGRATGETIPTLVNSSWEPTGDDYRNGDYLWNLKTYDWKGRVTRTIPSDSTGSDGKDTLISYAGCGCAGGQETTISGPKADAIDMGGTNVVSDKRKVQKIFEDILGRVVKKEVRSLDGTNLYSTTITEYNGRDQATEITEYQGAESGSNPHQITAMTYDGHGRLSTTHKPEWFDETPSSPTETTTHYNPDDTVNYVIDPRGAVTTYTYENVSGALKRPLVTGVAYATPDPNPNYITAPGNVTFTYDPAGNRATMGDDTGTLTYSYDELSRLVTESKNFTGTFTNEPPGGVFTLSYQYHLSGGLKSITDAFGNAAYYSADKAGRTTAIGSGSSTPNAYASSIAYRSFGAVKSMSMSTSNATSITMTYDDALRPLTYEADNSTTGSGFVQKASYTYHKDGTVKEIDNLRDGAFDQYNDYDFAGRLKKNQSSAFWQELAYDAFSNLTNRNTQTWGLDQISFTETYANNRNSSDTYDEAGNVIASSTTGGGEAPGGGWYASYKGWQYDASGRMARWEESGPWGGPMGTQRGGQSTFDGDGRPAKYAELEKHYNQNWTSINWYYLYSSVTGQKITDMISSGEYYGHRVYMGETVIHDNTYKGPYVDAPDEYRAIGFKVTDPVSGSTQEINPSGAVPSPSALPQARNELAGLGTSVPATAPTPYAPNYHQGGYAGSADSPCTWNWAPIDCSMIGTILRGGGQHTIYVNTRAEGGWSLLHSLESQVRTWRFNVRQVLDEEDSRLTKEMYKDPYLLKDLGGDKVGLLVGTFYASFLSETADSFFERIGSGGTGGNQSDKVKVRKQLSSYLLDKSRACAKALKALGLTDTDLLNGFNNNSFIPGTPNPGEDATTKFSWSQQGKKPKVWTTSTTSRHGVIDFLGKTTGFLIHELAHAVLHLGDAPIYNRLLQAQNNGQISGLPALGSTTTPSQAISTYLNDACRYTDGVDSPMPSSDKNSTSG